MLLVSKQGWANGWPPAVRARLASLLRGDRLLARFFLGWRNDALGAFAQSTNCFFEIFERVEGPVHGRKTQVGDDIQVAQEGQDRLTDFVGRYV